VVILYALAWMDFHELVPAGDLLSIVGVVGSVEDGLFVNSSYKGPKRRSNSCCDGTVVSAEGENFVVGGRGQSCDILTPFVVGERGLKVIVILSSDDEVSSDKELTNDEEHSSVEELSSENEIMIMGDILFSDIDLSSDDDVDSDIYIVSSSDEELSWLSN
ncbi:hypothetical protein Tco_1396515, partial [Tanacetum coccineum]